MSSGTAGATSTNGGTNAAGSPSGGASGGSGSGAGSSAGSSSGSKCGGVTRNGRCAGNVYEWCDYFTGGLARLDCTPLGATCRALDRQFYEDELNGCIAGSCSAATNASCDGALAKMCERGELVVKDCRKYGGPDSLCVAEGTQAGCTKPDCPRPNTVSCAGDLLIACNEYGELGIRDCARCDPAGTCVVTEFDVGEFSTDCDRQTFGCPE